MFRLLTKYLKPFLGGVVLVLALLLIQAAAELNLPGIMSRIVDVGIVRYGVESGDTAAYTGAALLQIQRSYLLTAGGQMVLLALLGGAAAILVGLFASRVSAGVARNLRRDLFAKINTFSGAEFDRFSTASLITRCTNDISMMQMMVEIGLRVLCLAPIMGVGGVIMAVRRSPSMSWVIGVSVLAVVGILTTLLVAVIPRFKLVQRMVDRINLVVRESLTGAMVVRAFGNRDYETGRFRKVTFDASRLFRSVNRTTGAMQPAVTLVMNLTAVAIVWVGAGQIQAGDLLVGEMIAFIQYSMQIISSFLMLSMLFFFLPQAAVSAERVGEVLYAPVAVVPPESPEDFDPARAGVVTFEHVTFQYDGADRPALDDVSFTARPGRTTAIIGSTGSGKTTVANLLLRFYDVTGGRVTVDGVDVRRADPAELRRRVGYVPQKGMLLSGNIGENLRYGRPDADDDTVALAARIARADGFIEEREDGLEAAVAQGGGNLSGGQRQRLSIARALVKGPEILFFDDSFSALDFKTDAAVRAALAEHTANATVLVVAQRVGTILHADEILVLEQGRIVGRGTHDELLVSCPEYAEIAASQLGRGEPA